MPKFCGQWGACALAALSLASAVRAEADEGKVPITTASEEARRHYLAGRDLLEKLRAADARSEFQKAVAADQGFALAYLGLANSAPSNKDFFAALDQAVRLAGKVSEGERHMVLGLDTGVRSDPAGQKAHYEQLTAAFPKDERAFGLLGNYHFGRQEYAEAIRAYEKSVALAPSFSPSYNQLGYAYRFLGRYDDAETSFKKYIELIPGDPNPYDSYAELLMRMGRFQESIANYEKALSFDPHFVASFVGIGLDQIYLGRAADARATFAKLSAAARNSGERRQALAQTAASYVHEGATAKALDAVEKMRAIAQEDGDKGAMSGDANFAGEILLDAGRSGDAGVRFVQSLDLLLQANVPDEVKEAARRNALYDEARVALAKGDVKTATAKAVAHSAAAAKRNVPFELWQTHEVAGLIALHQKDYVKAVAELRQANTQDPRVQYQLAQALRGKGDLVGARAAYRQAAEHNGLNFNYAFVRDKARKELSQM